MARSSTRIVVPLLRCYYGWPALVEPNDSCTTVGVTLKNVRELRRDYRLSKTPWPMRRGQISRNQTHETHPSTAAAASDRLHLLMPDGPLSGNSGCRAQCYSVLGKMLHRLSDSTTMGQNNHRSVGVATRTGALRLETRKEPGRKQRLQRAHPTSATSTPYSLGPRLPQNLLVPGARLRRFMNPCAPSPRSRDRFESFQSRPPHCPPAKAQLFWGSIHKLRLLLWMDVRAEETHEGAIIDLRACTLIEERFNAWTTWQRLGCHPSSSLVRATALHDKEVVHLVTSTGWAPFTGLVAQGILQAQSSNS